MVSNCYDINLGQRKSLFQQPNPVVSIYPPCLLAVFHKCFLFLTGLIHANHGGKIIDYLLQQLDSASTDVSSEISGTYDFGIR